MPTWAWVSHVPQTSLGLKLVGKKSDFVIYFPRRASKQVENWICSLWDSVCDSDKKQMLISQISQINGCLSSCAWYLMRNSFFLSSAKEALMDLNVKLMEEHFLAYQDKSHVWEGFCSGLLPLMGQAKMNSFQTHSCQSQCLYPRRESKNWLQLMVCLFFKFD